MDVLQVLLFSVYARQLTPKTLKRAETPRGDSLFLKNTLHESSQLILNFMLDTCAGAPITPRYRKQRCYLEKFQLGG